MNAHGNVTRRSALSALLSLPLAATTLFLLGLFLWLFSPSVLAAPTPTGGQIIGTVTDAATGASPFTPTPTPISTPGASSSFYGYACVDADCNTGSSQITARINGVDCGSAGPPRIVFDPEFFPVYWVDVASNADIPGCGTEGAPVDFYVDGRLAKQGGSLEGR